MRKPLRLAHREQKVHDPVHVRTSGRGAAFRLHGPISTHRSGESNMPTYDAANPFAEFNKMLEQFKLPGFDVPAVMEARRKDVEALVAANQTAWQGMQSLAQKQADMLRSTLTELQAVASKQAASGGMPSADTAELVQQTLHKALADMQQLAQAAYRSQADSYAVIAKRVEENVQELKTLMQQKK
jgi:phasin family protein